MATADTVLVEHPSTEKAPECAASGSILGPVVGILALAVVYWVIKGTDERAAT